MQKEYLTALKSRIFKILPLFEEANEGYLTYVAGCQHEVEGASYTAPDPAPLLAVASVLSFLAHGTYTHAECRREVFGMLTALDRMIEGVK